MQVNAKQSGASSLISSAASRTTNPSDFQAALDAAQQSLVQGRGSAAAVNSSKSAAASVAPIQKSAAQELAEYESKSVAQHMRDAILKEMGLSEEELDAMPPEQRAAVEERIVERMREKLLAQAGGTSNAAAQGSAVQLSLLTQGGAAAGALSESASRASLFS